MKITFLISHLTRFGGGGKFLMDYANSLSLRGHEIIVITQEINKKNYHFNENIKLIEVGGPLPKQPIHWFFLKNKIKKSFIDAIEKNTTDILLPTNFPTNYYCSFINPIYYKKLIYYCHEPYRVFHDKLYNSRAPIKNKIISLILQTLFKKYDIIGARAADYIICNSNFVRNKVLTHYNKNAIVHLTGVDINEYYYTTSEQLKEKYSIKDEDHVLFSIGLSDYLKGSNELIQIYNIIRNNKTHTKLFIAGKIENIYQKNIHKMIKKFEIPENNVNFLGFLSFQELRQIISLSSLTLYPAIHESFGLVPLESMSCGTPVIAFEGGPSETIINGKTGYILKTDDINGFANKALLLLNNQDLLIECSQNSIDHINNHFSFDKGTDRLEMILKKCIINKH